MRLRFPALLALVPVLVAGPVFASTPHIHRGPTSPRVSHSVAKPRVSGIDADRATQIQTALIKSGYMTGTPSGQWDAETQAAMVKLQADNGWQTKLVPDSRAIIKLGLGPGSTAPAAAAEPHETAEPGPNGSQAN